MNLVSSNPSNYSLYFANGDTVTGHPLDSRDANTIAWDSSAFRAPLNFAVGTVQSIQFKPAIDSNLVGPYCFELAGGDALNGSLAALDAQQAVITTTGLGRLHIDRSSLVRFFRTNSTDLVFAGPGGLDGWEIVGSAKAFHDEGGQLRADQPDATLRRTFSVPPLVRYELELSWTTPPNFELTVGLDKNRPNIRPAFRVETWGEQLVIIRESERSADFCSLQEVAPGPGQIHFQVLFDQKQGRLIVLSATGEKLADITVPEDKTPPASAVGKGKPTLFKLPAVASAPPGGMQLVNRRGDIKLQRLTISRWSGSTPESPTPAKAWVQHADGTERSVELRSYDAEKRQFIFRQGDADVRLDEKQLQHIVFSRADSEERRSVRLLLATGERVSGDLVSIQQEKITVQCPGVREPLVFSLDQLHSLFVLKPQVPKLGENSPLGGPPEGRLELDGVSLHGRLTGVQAGDSPGLVFQPRYAEAGSPLIQDISAKLIFREPPPEQPKPESTRTTRQGIQPVRVLNGVRTLLGARYTPATRPAAPGDCLLHLRSGDTIFCRVERTDEQGVWFKSTQTAATFVAHAKIKALELRQDVTPVKIDKTKADRLLTLPRMQRDNPPEQLIRSLDGDYLRGRLLAMDEQELQVELRLETRTVKRAQIARIIWLHPDEAAGATSPEPPNNDSSATAPPPGIRVQAVPRDGRRLTYFAQRLDGQILHGQSDVLGACRVGLDTVDQLFIGSAIDKSAATLAFHQWKLRPAPEPLPTPEESADPGASEGLESVLVGKPAPPIDLDLLDGKRFRLENYKNKVLVIDFWASWCGPCLQTMPQVEKVATEFAEQGVKLVAINLEESSERIRATLERLKLDMTVALDRDGRVAERYGATSIPQTVIIDREGKVARLFVGGSPRFDTTLRQALKSVLDSSSSKAE